jgi:hypothetical protein
MVTENARHQGFGYPNKLKRHRAVAIRYDRRDYALRRTIDVASLRIWLATLSHVPRGTA